MENVLPSPPTRTQTLCLQTQFSRVCNNSRLILKASSWCMKKIYFSPSYSVQVCVSGPICSSVGIFKELLSLFQIIDSFVSLSKEFGSMQRVDVHILIKFDTEKIGGRKSYVIKINMIKVVIRVVCSIKNKIKTFQFENKRTILWHYLQSCLQQLQQCVAISWQFGHKSIPISLPIWKSILICYSVKEFFLFQHSLRVYFYKFLATNTDIGDSKAFGQSCKLWH